jgi:hypothetical protein
MDHIYNINLFFIRPKLTIDYSPQNIRINSNVFGQIVSNWLIATDKFND